MRFASLVVVLALADAAQAQVSGVWGGAPRQLNFVPIDTSKVVTPTGTLSQAMRMPSTQANRPFSFSNIMPKFSLPSWPPKTPQVSVLPQSQNIYQPNPPKGAVNLFSKK
jgi:hypothetical protein